MGRAREWDGPWWPALLELGDLAPQLGHTAEPRLSVGDLGLDQPNALLERAYLVLLRDAYELELPLVEAGAPQLRLERLALSLEPLNLGACKWGFMRMRSMHIHI